MAGANSLGRLNEALFAELERLEGVDASDRSALDAEIERARAMQGVAREINASARTVFDMVELKAEWAGSRNMSAPKLLEG